MDNQTCIVAYTYRKCTIIYFWAGIVTCLNIVILIQYSDISLECFSPIADKGVYCFRS